MKRPPGRAGRAEQKEGMEGKSRESAHQPLLSPSRTSWRLLQLHRSHQPAEAASSRRSSKGFCQRQKRHVSPNCWNWLFPSSFVMAREESSFPIAKFTQHRVDSMNNGMESKLGDQVVTNLTAPASPAEFRYELKLARWSRLKVGG